MIIIMWKRKGGRSIEIYFRGGEKFYFYWTNPTMVSWKIDSIRLLHIEFIIPRIINAFECNIFSTFIDPFGTFSALYMFFYSDWIERRHKITLYVRRVDGGEENMFVVYWFIFMTEEWQPYRGWIEMDALPPDEDAYPQLGRRSSSSSSTARFPNKRIYRRRKKKGRQTRQTRASCGRKCCRPRHHIPAADALSDPSPRIKWIYDFIFFLSHAS